jgi:hypothetical protein
VQRIVPPRRRRSPRRRNPAIAARFDRIADTTDACELGEPVGRLRDVLPDGGRLITRRIYRLTDNQTGPITFEPHRNRYRFAPGDTVKLELLGRAAP